MPKKQVVFFLISSGSNKPMNDTRFEVKGEEYEVG